MSAVSPRLLRLFETLTARPRLVLLLSIALIVASGFGLTHLTKDVSVNAFIPPDHPSVLTDERIEEEFGLSDPIAVALVTEDGSSIFREHHLKKVREVTEALAELENVREDRITSLATESSIRGTAAGLAIEAYVSDDGPIDAMNVRERWRAMPPHSGTLVSEDEAGTIILAELVDQERAVDTYHAVLALTKPMAGDGIRVHVAGPAAVSGYLSEAIDADARVLQPLIFVVVLLFLYAAFRSFTMLLGPLAVLIGTAACAMGIMGWQGVSYFAITNALPIILIAIAVADSIHILSEYYVLRAARPEAPAAALVHEAMVAMARPITLTTLTTAAGFTGIGLASIMPPMTYFAVYAAFGVVLAWLFSMVTLPCLMVLLRLGPSPAFVNWSAGEPSGIGAFLFRIASACARSPVSVVLALVLMTALALMLAQELRIDRSSTDYFAPSEPVRIADETINAQFAGTAFLDVVVEADEPEGLLDPEQLQRIVALQAYFEDLPHVEVTVGITDYLGLLHGALFPEEAPPPRALPADADAVAQYLLLYEASGDPTDFEEEIDAAYQHALIRGVMDTAFYSETRDTVRRLEQYLETEFNGSGLTATVGGEVNLIYHWMTRLGASHFQGVALSLFMVLVMAIAVFRSLSAGLLAVLPVSFTVLLLYAVMATAGIYLEPATSMFAAIAVGVGVDFAIHLVDRLRVCRRRFGGDLDRAIRTALPLTARACFFNAAALGLGFSVMLGSGLPMLQRFGALVAIATLASFVVALLLIPALYRGGHQLKGWLLRRIDRPQAAPLAKTAALAMVLLTVPGTGLSEATENDAEARGRRVAERVFHRPEGRAAQRTIEMTLTDRRGGERERTALVLKLSDEDERRTRITYLAPKAVRNTAFLSYDRLHGEGKDDRWLFIPAARKVRQIPAADRGDYFLGTDFSYEDIQSELKFDLSDYFFEYVREDRCDDKPCDVVAGVPQTKAIGRELGYGRFEAVVDRASAMPLRIEFSDLRQKPLKTITINAFEQIDGIWTATDIVAEHLQKKHKTRFRFRDIDYPEQLAQSLFEADRLQRRLPDELLPETL